MDKREEWYLKYTPEISEDIFNILKDRLNTELGIQFNHSNIGTSYNSFRKNKFIRTAMGNTQGAWCVDNNSQSGKLQKSIFDLIPPQEQKECILEDGKWFHIQMKGDHNEWLFKRNSVYPHKTSNSKAVIIPEGNVYLDNYVAEDKNIEWIKPASLDEVYKYFPEERPKQEKVMKYPIGPIAFAEMNGNIPNYSRDIKQIKDGSRILNKTTSNIKIIGYEKEFYIVSYNDEKNNEVILGFTEDKLKPVETPVQSFIPEYVECIASINGNHHPKVGQIIKADSRGYLYGICIYNSISYKDCFRRSTKEAFEAQNTAKSLIPSIEEDWCYKPVEVTRKYLAEFLKSRHSYYDGNSQTMYYGVLNTKIYASNTTWGKLLTTEEFYNKIGKEVPGKEESLVGRYLKALLNNPQGCGDIKYEEYLKIDSLYYNNKSGIGKSHDNKTWNWELDIRCWELMPVGFIPHSSKPTSSMSKEELLEEAKRKYPIGTKFKSVRSGREFTVNSNTHKVHGELNNIDVDSIPFLRYNGNWSEIISSPDHQTVVIKESGIPKYSYIEVKNDSYSYLEPQGRIYIDAEVFNLKAPKSTSVILKSTENEVKIVVKPFKTIKL